MNLLLTLELTARGQETNPNNEFTKKELLKLTNKHIKLVRSLSGISEMQKAPDLVFVIDTKLEHIAIAEARTLKIPVVGICKEIQQICKKILVIKT